MSKNVDLMIRNADLFEEVRAHNFDVLIRRLGRANPEAPENQYRNAFAEATAREAQDSAA